MSVALEVTARMEMQAYAADGFTQDIARLGEGQADEASVKSLSRLRAVLHQSLELAMRASIAN